MHRTHACLGVRTAMIVAVVLSSVAAAPSAASATGWRSAPTAAFTVSPNPTIGQPVTFDGSGSTCVVTPCTYTWDDDGGEPPTGYLLLGTGPVIQHTFQGSAFTAYVRLTVADRRGRTATVEHNVYVAAAAPLSNTALPVISGTATQGNMLTTSSGSWSGSPSSYGYQWRDCDSSGANCSNISGATSSSYRLGSSDVGHTMRAVVTATSAGGSKSASSNQTAVVVAAPPSNTALPVINGAATQGDTLTTSNGSWSGSPTSYGYQWRHCDSSGSNCSNVAGATGSTYAVQVSDVGGTIDVIVAATNSVGSVSATSAPTATVTSGSALIYGSQGGPYASETQTWPGASWQPYAQRSWWNVQLPSYSSAVLSSDSANEIAYMRSNWQANFTPWEFSNTPSNDESSKWQHPVYWAKSTDPTYTIVDNGEPCVQPGSSSCPTTVQIPNGAQHALSGDGHLAVVEPDGSEIDFWQVQNANPLSGGGTLTVSAYGELAGPNGAATDGIDGNGCCGASNNLYELVGGNVRAQELAAGTINHALSASEECSNGTSVPPDPAGISGGGSTCAGGGDAPPQGARLQLKMTDATINGLSVPAWEKTVFTAMAHYGLFISDTGGAPMDLYFEPTLMYSAFGNRSNTLMTFFASAAGGRQTDPYSPTLGLPWSDFQVVNSCYSTTAGC